MDDKRFSKLGRSQEKPLEQPGGGGRGQMKRTEKGKQNPDERTAHINLLVPQSEARSRIMLSAAEGGGGAGGRGGGEEGTETAQVREPASHHGGGAADWEAEPSQAAPGS